jgi:ActR/RegA family two-component response regulator
VEDKVDARESLQLALDDFDCDFQEAENVAQALKLIRAREFDVIFLDLKLPDGDGIELLRAARTVRPNLGKVIVVTGLPDEKTRRESAQLGAVAYLVKLDYEEIRATFSKATLVSPRAATPDSQPAEAPVQTSSSSRDVDGANRMPLPRLLVLDDDQAWLDGIREVLENDFDLTTTSSPGQACRLAAADTFALAIVDMKLGEITGLEVLKRLREAAPGLRAIILTGYPDLATAFESGKSDALAYVEKTELATLAEKVKLLLSAKSHPDRVFLSYADSDFDQVAKLFDELTKRGFLPFMAPKTIVPGQAWELEIQKAINEADYFVFCHSRQSARREGMIRKEVRQALERQRGMNDDTIFFVTGRLDGCEVSPPLNERQWVNLFDEDGFANLMKAFSPHGK